MDRSFRLARIAGIEVKVHLTFFLLLLLVALPKLFAVQFGAALYGVLLTIFIFACVLLHELAHSLVARGFGIQVKDITLFPLGGLARMGRIPEKPYQELLISVAGPAVNFVLAAIFFLMIPEADLAEILGGGRLAPGGGLLRILLSVNLMLGLFNLVPAFPMDGGRIFRAFLSKGIGFQKATRWAVSVGHALALLMIGWGVLANPLNPWLVIIGLFIYMGATSEGGIVQVRGVLADLEVRHAMVPDFRVVTPGDPLSAAFEILVHSYQNDIPVVDEGKVVGLLSKGEIAAFVREGGDLETEVASVMRTGIDLVAPGQSLGEAHEKMMTEALKALPVVDEAGRLVGIVTQENIGEVLLSQEARRFAATTKKT